MLVLGDDDNSSSDKEVVTPGSSQPSTKTTLGRVCARGTLLCGVADGHAGFSDVDSSTGEIVGIDAELVSQQCDLFALDFLV